MSDAVHDHNETIARILSSKDDEIARLRAALRRTLPQQVMSIGIKRTRFGLDFNERTYWGVRNPFFKYSIPKLGKPRRYVGTKFKLFAGVDVRLRG